MNFIKNLLLGDNPHKLFHKLEKEHASRIWRLAVSRGLPKEAAEDVCQEIWLGFHQHLQQKSHEKPQLLLYAIARNKIKDYYRKHYEEKSRVEPLDQDAVSPLSELTPNALISFYQLLEAAHIQEDTRTYMELRFVSGMTFPEIADAFKVPQTTVRDHVNRAITAMNKVYSRGRKQ